MEQNLDEMFKVYLDEMFKVLAYAKATKEVFGEELFSKVFTEQIAKETEKEEHKPVVPETFEGLAPEPKEKTWEPKYKVGDKVLFKVSKNGNYAGVVIHINHMSHIYTLGMLEDAPDTHNGVRATFAIDDICHVKKKFRHFVKDAECRWAYDFELEPYEEKTELKVGDRVCIEGVVDGVTGSGDFFILFDGEEKCGHTYISSSAEFKKVNK